MDKCQSVTRSLVELKHLCELYGDMQKKLIKYMSPKRAELLKQEVKMASLSELPLLFAQVRAELANDEEMASYIG